MFLCISRFPQSQTVSLYVSHYNLGKFQVVLKLGKKKEIKRVTVLSRYLHSPSTEEQKLAYWTEGDPKSPTPRRGRLTTTRPGDGDTLTFKHMSGCFWVRMTSPSGTAHPPKDNSVPAHGNRELGLESAIKKLLSLECRCLAVPLRRPNRRL